MAGARNIREAILECFRARQGGPLQLQEVEAWVKQQYPRRWAEVYADMAELVMGRASECYAPNEQCLHRVSKGVYQLDPAFLL